MTEVTIISNWQGKVNYSPEAPQPQTLMDNGKVKVIMAGLEPGQKFPLIPKQQPFTIFWKALVGCW